MKGQFSFKTLVLLAAVLFIWGTISWRLYKGIDSEERPDTSKASPTRVKKPDSLRVATYSLSLNYHDPFLGNREARILPKKPSNLTIKTGDQSLIILPSFDFLNFVYKGNYFNKKINTNLAILHVNGEEVIAKEGEKVNGLFIMKITNDSIQLGSGNGSYWVRKNGDR